jgi:hypothetical protein
MFVTRAECEDRGDEELMILPLDWADDPNELGIWDWDWEPSRTLTQVIERGLQYPRRAFSFYLKTTDVSLTGAILAFATDNKVIFGVSLDDEGAKPENLERAKILMHEMIRSFGGCSGFVGVEMPPPLTGRIKSEDRLVYSWSGE